VTTSPLARFVIRVVAWLPVAFAVWYLAAPALVWPARLLAELVARVGFGDLVRAVEQSGATLTFATSLRPGTATAATGSITVDVNTLLYSFGLPLYAALVLAARAPGWPQRLALGYVGILPFIAWGALADFLKNVAITAGPLVASQAGFSAWQREVIAFAYQFGTLILPTVVPAILWVLGHRTFLEGLRRSERAAGPE
jgi:hypothetical protein